MHRIKVSLIIMLVTCLVSRLVLSAPKTNYRENYKGMVEREMAEEDLVEQVMRSYEQQPTYTGEEDESEDEGEDSASEERELRQSWGKVASKRYAGQPFPLRKDIKHVYLTMCEVCVRASVNCLCNLYPENCVDGRPFYCDPNDPMNIRDDLDWA